MKGVIMSKKEQTIVIDSLTELNINFIEKTRKNGSNLKIVLDFYTYNETIYKLVEKLISDVKLDSKNNGYTFSIGIENVQKIENDESSNYYIEKIENELKQFENNKEDNSSVEYSEEENLSQEIVIDSLHIWNLERW